MSERQPLVNYEEDDEVPEPRGVKKSSRNQAQSYQATSSTPPPLAPVGSGSVRDYIKHNVVGTGAFGNVYHVTEKSTGKDLALKECHKQHIIENNAAHLVMRERRAMARVNHPFIIHLVKAFQDSHILYFVMDLMAACLIEPFKKFGHFRNEVTRFYTAELILALEHLRTVLVVHKDLKMRNILLDNNMHIKLADFGCCTFLEDQNPHQSRRQQARANRPVMINHMEGTPCYFAPEIVEREPVTFGTDLWGLGCMLYEMHTGEKAFQSDISWENLQEKIVSCDHAPWPVNSDPALIHLVSKLLDRDPKRRLGTNNMDHLKLHPFYGSTDVTSWEHLHTVVPPPFSPLDPRAMADGSDRPSYGIFFQPETDSMPSFHSEDAGEFDDFDDDSIAGMDDGRLCGRMRACCTSRCNIL